MLNSEIERHHTEVSQQSTENATQTAGTFWESDELNVTIRHNGSLHRIRPEDLSDERLTRYFKLYRKNYPDFSNVPITVQVDDRENLEDFSNNCGARCRINLAESTDRSLTGTMKVDIPTESIFRETEERSSPDLQLLHYIGHEITEPQWHIDNRDSELSFSGNFPKEPFELINGLLYQELPHEKYADRESMRLLTDLHYGYSDFWMVGGVVASKFVGKRDKFEEI